MEKRKETERNSRRQDKITKRNIIRRSWRISKARRRVIGGGE